MVHIHPEDVIGERKKRGEHNLLVGIGALLSPNEIFSDLLLKWL